jgi:hypothetical protein
MEPTRSERLDQLVLDLPWQVQSQRVLLPAVLRELAVSHRTRPRNSGMSSGTGVRPSSSCQAVRQRHELDAIAHEPRFPQLQRSVT